MDSGKVNCSNHFVYSFAIATFIIQHIPQTFILRLIYQKEKPGSKKDVTVMIIVILPLGCYFPDDIRGMERVLKFFMPRLS